MEDGTFEDDEYLCSLENDDLLEFEEPRPVSLVWSTPDGDSLIAYMARVSNSKATLDDPSDRLIAFLLRNHHWSPFEMVNMCVEVHTERDISAQILRHSKEFRFQEFSTRYAEVEELRYSTECRFQDDRNRQNSRTIDEHETWIQSGESTGNDYSPDALEAIVSYFDAVINETRERSMEAYRELLARGVAKECARRVLPIGLMPTKMYINSNVRGWMHYIAERTKPGVQKEHREIALAVEGVFAEAFPLVYSAITMIRNEETKNNWRIEQMKQIEQAIHYADDIDGWDPAKLFAGFLQTYAK